MTGRCAWEIHTSVHVGGANVQNKQLVASPPTPPDLSRDKKNIPSSPDPHCCSAFTAMLHSFNSRGEGRRVGGWLGERRRGEVRGKNDM